ncbi:MAG: hypothetical protein JW958_14070 [Candidatus Eisenbacteria bacterium]|nr:hypothetical protein [Candidatus Eisenbacteria bacterium]
MACRWNGSVAAAWIATAAAWIALYSLPGCGVEETPAGSSNRNPVIDSVTVHPDTVLKGERDTVEVVVYAYDPDGDSLTYSFSSGGGPIYLTGTRSRIFWLPPDTLGPWTMLASAMDGRDGVASRAATVIVTELPTGLSGTVQLAVGAPGTMIGARLYLFDSLDDFEHRRDFMKIWIPETSPATYNFTIANLRPGAYYLDVWKDLDEDQELGPDDLYGLYGTGRPPNAQPQAAQVIQNRITRLGILTVE